MTRASQWTSRLGILAIASVLGACSGREETSNARITTDTGPLARAFVASASESGAPRDLLVAIAIVEEGLEVPAERLALHETAVPAAGPLMLRHGKLDTLARGAASLGTTEDDLRRHGDLALVAGARVLAELGRDAGAREDDLASWSAAIEEMSGYADAAHRARYAHRVFATLARGGAFPARDGETITLPRHDLPPSLTITIDLSHTVHPLAGTPQFPGAEWIPTSCANKCDPTRSGAKVEYVVIHDTEGGWEGSVATLQNDPKKSVQYIVGADGRIGQFLTEETMAWHAGNSYYNQRSVGIEHVGYATKTFPAAEYAASAKLVDHLASKYGIARDRAHVIGHDQVPNGNKIPAASAPCAEAPASCEHDSTYGGASNHDDPGIWEWATYMNRIAGAAKCTDTGPLWSCSNDKTQAFRCANDAVEVVTCDSPCEPQTKADAICHVTPKSEPAPSAAPANDPPPPPVIAPDPPPPAEDDAGGCSSSKNTKTDPASALALGLVLALVVRARMKKRGEAA